MALLEPTTVITVKSFTIATMDMSGQQDTNLLIVDLIYNTLTHTYYLTSPKGVAFVYELGLFDTDAEAVTAAKGKMREISKQLMDHLLRDL